MPRLSIIIPTLGDWEALETTLLSVLENRPSRSEIIVVLDRPYQDPYDLKDEVRFIQAGAQSCLVDLLNAGLGAARSEVVHLLACGATVHDGWTAPVVRQFVDSPVAAVAPVVLDANSPQRILTAGCMWSLGGSFTAFAQGRQADDIKTEGRRWVGPSITAAFYRRSSLARVGLLDATLLPELAGIDLALRLLQSGHRSVLETGSRVFIESRRLPCARPFTDAWHGERLFWRHVSHRGWLRGVAAHGWTLGAEALRSVPKLGIASQIVGRVMGACDRRAPRLARVPSAVETTATPVTGGMERRVDAQHAVPPPALGAGVTSNSRALGR